MEEGLVTEILGIDIDTWNNMPVMSQIKAIEENTKNIDANTKAILEELQKEDSVDQLIESPEFQALLITEPEVVEPTEEPVELPTEEPIEEPVEETTEEKPEETTEEATGEEPTEEPKEEVTEEVPEEEVPVEKPIDYQKLIYEELKLSNEIDAENQVAIMEQLTLIEQHGVYSNETDGMFGMYLTWIVPFLLIIFLFSKLINPFTKF